MKWKIIIKRMIYLNFITRFVGRIITQRLYKTYNLFVTKERFKASLWVDWNKELFDSWAKKKNGDLYSESIRFSSCFSAERKQTIQGLPISGGGTNAVGGGGGNVALLYFLVRLISPRNALETGVSAGSSSRAILEAMKKNGEGNLFSSDLALTLKKDEVGILVTDELRKNWSLFDRGDKENIPEIFSRQSDFDFVYYDSEKSYESKKWFHKEVVEKIKPKILVYDDIDRDSFFSDCVALGDMKYRVFGNAGIIFYQHDYY